MIPPRVSLLIAAFLLLACIARLGAEEAAVSVALVPGGGPAMKGVACKFFDDKTGYCTGQLKIGSVNMEYRKQGFLRVAWRPLVVLSQVDLDIHTDMAWAAQGAQIGHQLLALGGRDELVLRDVRLHLAGSPRREITAPTARLLRNGMLELDDAVVADGDAQPFTRPAATLRLPLTGPNAGRLMTAAASSPGGLTGREKTLASNAQPTLSQ